MHSYLHIAHRFKEDGHKMGFSDTLPRDYPKREELNKTAEEIRKNL